MTPADPKRADDEQTVIPDFVIESMAQCLLPQVQAFYASPEGQAAFEEYKNQHLQEVSLKQRRQRASPKQGITTRAPEWRLKKMWSQQSQPIISQSQQLNHL